MLKKTTKTTRQQSIFTKKKGFKKLFYRSCNSQEPWGSTFYWLKKSHSFPVKRQKILSGLANQMAWHLNQERISQLTHNLRWLKKSRSQGNPTYFNALDSIKYYKHTNLISETTFVVREWNPSQKAALLKPALSYSIYFFDYCLCSHFF